MITKSPYGLGIMVVFLVVAIAVAALSIDTTLSAYAQNTTTPTPTSQPSQNQTADPQQIKNYLTQAIQALDIGNNTKALEQVDLAEDQLEGVTGTEDAEDEDEPGDIDTNDEEDTP